MNTAIIITLIICTTLLSMGIIFSYIDVKEKIIEHKHNERMRELAIDAERVKVTMEEVKRGAKK